MPLPPPFLPGPTGLAELALTGSLLSQADSGGNLAAQGAAIRRFWSANRRLQHQWLDEIGRFSEDISENALRFERLSLEVLLTELLSRVWATSWTIADRIHGERDVERILINVLHGMARVHREILLLMVRNWDGPATKLISRLDRFRRRSERWTDMLIAGPASIHGVWDFAVDPDRARDFGLDRQTGGTAAVNPASLLVSAGLRVMFAASWPPGCCEGPPFPDLLDAIVSTMPPEAFDAGGALRPAWRWPA